MSAAGSQPDSQHVPDFAALAADLLLSQSTAAGSGGAEAEAVDDSTLALTVDQGSSSSESPPSQHVRTEYK